MIRSPVAAPDIADEPGQVRSRVRADGRDRGGRHVGFPEFRFAGWRGVAATVDGLAGPSRVKGPLRRLRRP
jgi:hypothetical protein